MKRFNWLLIGLVVLCLAMVPLAGCVSKSKYEALREDYEVLQEDKASLEREMESLKEELENLEESLSLYKDTYGEVFSGTQPPFAKSSGVPINLINNKNAVNPSWKQLVAFLNKDETDEHTYGVRVCGDFAEELHNNAEANGIRTALVAIDFKTGLGHALNAFKTTDKGLVFIDCTGTSFAPQTFRITSYNTWGLPQFSPEPQPENLDKVAYVVLGKKLGFVSLNLVQSPQYNFYESYESELKAYLAELERYNKKVEVHNREVEAYSNALTSAGISRDIFGVTLKEADYPKFAKWYQELKKRGEELENMLKPTPKLLGDFYWEPLGIVTNIKIYW